MRVIPVYKNPSELLPVVMEETGGLGVDIVVDQGGTYLGKKNNNKNIQIQ